MFWSTTDLYILATAPEFQGKGVGSMLLDWGLEIAKQEGLDAWLLAAPSAHEFYIKKGFEDVGFFDLDLEACGIQNGGVQGEGELAERASGVGPKVGDCRRTLMRFRYGS
jgi:predicted N-acetyltransferase YhbS